MPRFFIVLFLRNLQRNFRFQFINILSFSASIYLAMVVLIYVRQELAYNSNFPDSQRIYRLTTDVTSSSYSEQIGMTLSFTGPLITASIPEIEYSSGTIEKHLIDIAFPGQDRIVVANVVLEADTNYFNIFKLPLLSGDTAKSPKLNDAFVSSKFSADLFGQENPVGNEIIVDGRSYLVKGVVDNSTDTDLDFNVLLFRQLESEWSTTFLKTGKHTGDVDRIEKKINSLLLEQLSGEYNEEAMQLSFSMESLADLHFTKALFNNFRASDKTLISILIISSILLMFCAMFNSVNLIVAGSASRVKEFSLKRIYGAKNLTIFFQLGAEVIIPILLSSMVAGTILFLSLENLTDFFGNYKIKESPFDLLFFSIFILIIAILVILTSILSYYFFYESIKGSLINRKIYVINQRFTSLVVLQVIICFSLLCMAYFVNNQIQLIRDQNLLSSYERLIVTKFSNSESYNRCLNFKHHILRISSVESAAFCHENSVLGSQPNLDLFKFQDAAEAEAFLAKRLLVDKDYFKTMGIPLAEEKIKDNNWHNQLILSASAAKMASDGIEVGIDKMNNRIIAGISDHFTWNLYRGIEPIVFHMDSTQLNSMIIGFRAEVSNNDIEMVAREWSKFFPNTPFNYEYLSQSNARIYHNEFLIGKFLTSMSLLVYAISLIGILTITSMSIMRRLKEFSIRRVFGATEIGLTLRLGHYLGKIFIVAFCFSIPLIYFTMDQWLIRFKDSISIGLHEILMIFFLFVLISIALNILFVRKLLNTNPIKILKDY
ncbi:ABC transporter permease [Fulvivirgaceae bacterium BMA12]|uniref:ABC transporter permease n=1 Tax=Agaribacillus aureus TaxID=3051825 RepID=A0ABT8L0F0_9BACT|nr:ABC transporter permease [Fulvivirgaceae bacterium BMA12]